MSTLMALRLLRHTVKNTKAITNHGNFNRLPALNPATTQLMMTKAPMTTNSSRQVDNSEEWRIIYRLPLIRLASAFNRVKIPYGFVNCIALPAAFALEQASHIPASSSLLVATLGLTSWSALAISSYFIKNLVGIIYVNDNNDKLKLAYVDYWGKRHDVCIELNDLLTEGERSKFLKFDFYQKLHLCSDKKVKYTLLQKYGNIEEPLTFSAIFGE